MSNSTVDMNVFAANAIADSAVLGLLLFLATKNKEGLELAGKTLHAMVATVYESEMPAALKEQLRTRLDLVVDAAMKQHG